MKTNTVKRPRISPRNRRTNGSTPLKQVELFNDVGLPLFCYARDAVQCPDRPDIVKVGGMRFHLRPTPQNPPKAFEKIFEALCLLYVERYRWSGPTGRRKPLELDVYKCHECIVYFRPESDDGVIEANYDLKLRKLELSLPHPCTWRKVGLYWLMEFQSCCNLSRKNPTPWLGRPCDCGPDGWR